MTFTPDRAKTTRKATTIKAELKHNLGSLLGKVVYTPTYEGASADWNREHHARRQSAVVRREGERLGRPAQRVDRLLAAGERPESLRPRRRSVVEQTYEADYRTLIKGEADRS